VLRRPYDAPGAALPLHREHLVPDLEPARRVEAEVPVERPAIEAPHDGQLGRVFDGFGVPEAASGENARREGLRGRVGGIAPDSRPVASQEPAHIGTFVGLCCGRRNPLCGAQKTHAGLAKRGFTTRDEASENSTTELDPAVKDAWIGSAAAGSLPA